jgi:amino acid transporter
MAEVIESPPFTATHREGQLAADAIGSTRQVFQSITHIGPAAGVIFSVQYMASQGGPVLPLAWLLAMVGALFAAYCLRQLVAQVRGAGGYFVMHSKALGKNVGFLSSWVYLIYDSIVPCGLLVGFGAVFLEPFSKAHFGFTIPWWATLVVGTALLTFLTASGIRESANGAVILGTIETVIMVVFGVLLVINAPNGQDLSTFTPAAVPNHLTGPTPFGLGGLAFAVIFSFGAFSGFESGLPLSEETRDARRSIMLAVIASVLIVGAVFVFLGYASAVGWGGTAHRAAFAQSFSSASNPFGAALATRAFGVIGPWLILFALLNSTFAVSLAGWNATTRIYFSLARAGMFPRALGIIDPKTNVPRNAIFVQAVITLAAGILAGILFGSVNTIGVLGLIYGLDVSILYIFTNISVFVQYYFRARAKFNWFKHAIVPLIATIVWLVPLYASIKFNPDPPFVDAPWIVLGWLGVGVAFFYYLRRWRPGSFERLVQEAELVTNRDPEPGM